jgi:hypothetical protein
VLRFGEDQGVSDLPSFDGDNNPDDSRTPLNGRRQQNGNNDNDDNVTFRSSSSNNYYPTASDVTNQTTISRSDRDYGPQSGDSYLVPIATSRNNQPQQRTVAGNLSTEMIPLIEQNKNLPTTDARVPEVTTKSRAPFRKAPAPPSVPSNDRGDSYV